MPKTKLDIKTQCRKIEDPVPNKKLIRKTKKISDNKLRWWGIYYFFSFFSSKARGKK